MIERLKLIIDYYNLSASSFADKIDVPRSSISHLLSGRNKPSLDFLMKVVNSFEAVDLNWVVFGKGSFPKTNEPEQDSSAQSQQSFNFTKPEPQKIEEEQTNTIELSPTKSEEIETIKELKTDSSKKLVKIILLYNDGSFEDYTK